jgi:hypothetical protein
MKFAWITAFLISKAVFATEPYRPDLSDMYLSRIDKFRKTCVADQHMTCTDISKDTVAVTFNFDLTQPEKRVFLVTDETIRKAEAFLEDQQMERPSKFRTTVKQADPANDWIAELEYRRNVISYLETACIALSGTCVYVASKVVKINTWGLFVYSGCGSLGAACRVRGEDDIKRYDEEIKQIKKACEEGADDAACLKRVEKGMKAKLLPADNPPPRPDPFAPGNESGAPDYNPNPGGTGGDGGWTSVPPGKVCVSNTISSSGGPLGETAEEELVCYDI